MKEHEDKSFWAYNRQYSPETTVFDTYLEEQKSRSSTPNTIVRKSPVDIKLELLSKMESLQGEFSEHSFVQQMKKLEFRKTLLKVLNKTDKNNRSLIKQIIRTIPSNNDNENLRQNLLKTIDSSKHEKFILIFNSLGQHRLPIGVYFYERNETVKLFGPNNLPDVLLDSFIRFTLKFDLMSNKFKVLKTKTFNDNIDAAILR